MQLNKLLILSRSARYDVSCASSGSKRTAALHGTGNTTPAGICHSFSEDGRCISLLKVLLSNICIYDCAYCINRRSNDIPRASFTVRELVSLTLEFYKRNYVEGLFLSSGILRNPDYTMESMIRVAKELRVTHRFGGYIHLKIIPGSSPELIRQAGLYADRLSVNLELPSADSLHLLAPEKNHQIMTQAITCIHSGIEESRVPQIRRNHPPPSVEIKSNPKTNAFSPAGQSTQLIVGATPDTDWKILRTADHCYRRYHMKRVYYSAYIPVNNDSRLPTTPTPRLREHRLYQADWLMRFYHFQLDELLDGLHPYLDTDIDPKLAWALRHPELFPIDLNSADYEMILRVPGIGVRSARQIIRCRRHGAIRAEHLRHLGVAMNRARYFIIVPDHIRPNLYPEQIRARLLGTHQPAEEQLDLFSTPFTAPISYSGNPHVLLPGAT